VSEQVPNAMQMRLKKLEERARLHCPELLPGIQKLIAEEPKARKRIVKNK